jgi:hypothetical protein
LIEHAAMLRRDTNANREVTARAQFANQRAEFDGLWARAEDEEQASGIHGVFAARRPIPFKLNRAGRDCPTAVAVHHDAIIIMMRTTVNLPDDLYEVARSLAASRKISLGEALADLIRKGLHPIPRIESKRAFPYFSVADDAPVITLERTLEAEDEL